jgi:hypothetical protein
MIDQCVWAVRDCEITQRFSFVASGQIKLPKIDGWRKIATVLSLHTAVAA